jgi:hypothetical protein
MLLWVQNCLMRTKCETMRCRDVTGSTFVAKLRREVFAHFQSVATKRHSIVRNCLASRGEFLSTIPLVSKKVISMLFILLFTCLTFIGLGKFVLSVYDSCILPRKFV